jgi:hypothetical protein
MTEKRLIKVVKTYVTEHVRRNRPTTLQRGKKIDKIISFMRRLFNGGRAYSV